MKPVEVGVARRVQSQAGLGDCHHDSAADHMSQVEMKPLVDRAVAVVAG